MATINTNAAEAGSTTRADREPVPLDQVVCDLRACGHLFDLTLSEFQASRLSEHLRGIEAVASVLTAGDGFELKIEPALQYGLLSAVLALASSADQILETVKDKAAKADKGQS